MKNMILGLIIIVILILEGCKSTNEMNATTKDTIGITSISTVVTTEINYEQKVVIVSSADELTDALKSAKPGHHIILKSGVYIGNKNKSGDSRTYFYAKVDGMSEYPITLESEDVKYPATLSGTDINTGYGLYITGDYWIIKNVKVEKAQKGIMLDHSNHTIISGCEIYNIGHEAIHLRDGSSHNIVDNCSIYDTGLVKADYGEGVYVGSDKGKWTQFEKKADSNIIRNNSFGPNVAAEHIDIKEGSTGTIIEYNHSNGIGILGANYADSFYDIKGNQTIVRHNTVYQNNNLIIKDAFQVSTQISGWGFLNEFYENTVYLEPNGYVVNVFSGSAKVHSNTRNPEGNMYKGNIINLDQ